jgi:F0F1-type ATP synthase assembly protein I
MGDFFRRQLFNIIAVVFLALFVAVWGTVLVQVGFWVPDGRSTAPDLNGAVVCAAGVLSTSLSSLTSSALGFTIAEVRRDQQDRDRAAGEKGAVNTGEVTMRLSGRIVTAVMVYLVIGLLVLAVWLLKGQAGTDLIGAFSLSLLGWIIGAAGVVFQTEKTADEPHRAG